MSLDVAPDSTDQTGRSDDSATDSPSRARRAGRFLADVGRWTSWALLVAYVVLVALVLASSGAATVTQWTADQLAAVNFAPVVTDRARLIVDAVAFAPIPVLGSLAFGRSPVGRWVTGLFLAALALVAVQGLADTASVAPGKDVVAHTIGAMIGAVLVALVVAAVRRPGRRRRAAAAASGQASTEA